jgi:hypothetical protein
VVIFKKLAECCKPCGRVEVGLLPEIVELLFDVFESRLDHPSDLVTQELGPDHPDTLTSRNNLALTYGAAGRTDESIRLHEQALAARERVLGSDHPDTLQSRNNLANAYKDEGRTEEATNHDP